LRKTSLLIAAVLAAGGLLSSAAAQIFDPEVEGNEVTATVELPGDVKADLSVRFEDATGLTLASLGLSAKTINPLDPALLNRLQEAGLVSAPAGFPVMITIDPPAGGGLSFDGLVEVELYTTNLHYAAGTPLRLFSAAKGGQFHDITDMIAGGSYRTRGTKGKFSDFLVVADTRPLQQVIAVKFNKLENALIADAATIGASLGMSLNAKLTAARSAWQAADFADAIDAIESFEEAVADAGEAGLLPNEWRAAGGVRNLAGELRADARTLRFSLTLAANNL
jgi:hypothetical protein